MGYDAFGLPAEQYAIEHGVHPAVSTHKNIDTFRAQLDNIGFSYDWSREIRTCDATYYKWTQWIFLQLFNSFYNTQKSKAEPIQNLIMHLKKMVMRNINVLQMRAFNLRQLSGRRIRIRSNSKF